MKKRARAKPKFLGYYVGLRRATIMYSRAFEAADDEEEQEEQEWWRRARTKMMKKRVWRVRNSRGFLKMVFEEDEAVHMFNETEERFCILTLKGAFLKGLNVVGMPKTVAFDLSKWLYATGKPKTAAFDCLFFFLILFSYLLMCIKKPQQMISSRYVFFH